MTGLGQNFVVEFHFEILHQFGGKLVKVLLDVGHGAVFVEGFPVGPFFDVSEPARIILPLIEFIADATCFAMRVVQERVQGCQVFIDFVLFGAKLGGADNLSGVSLW